MQLTFERSDLGHSSVELVTAVVAVTGMDISEHCCETLFAKM